MSRNKSKKSPQILRVCVFCGGNPLTEQHVFPKWMESEFKTPRNGTSNIRMSFDNPFNKTLNLSSSVTFKKNRTIGKKLLKYFCATCNNGWMSKIEEAAKPLIIDLIRERKHKLDVGEQLILSRWACLSTIVYEFDDYKTKVITKAERQNFMYNITPPASWEIWVGKAIVNNENERRILLHTALSAGIRHSEGILPITKEHANIQNTIIGVEGLTFVTKSNALYIQTNTSLPILDDNFIKIWPALKNTTDEISSARLSYKELESYRWEIGGI